MTSLLISLRWLIVVPLWSWLHLVLHGHHHSAIGAILRKTCCSCSRSTTTPSIVARRLHSSPILRLLWLSLIHPELTLTCLWSHSASTVAIASEILHLSACRTLVTSATTSLAWDSFLCHHHALRLLELWSAVLRERSHAELIALAHRWCVAHA